MTVCPISESFFLRRLTNPTLSETFCVRMEGGDIPVLVTRRASPTVIITFAGRVDRARQSLPQFGAAKLADYVAASVIGIADPSLPQSSTLTTAWYAGHEGFETQQVLPTLIEHIVTACDAERVIFLGGSSGGFAALYYSWRLPRSIAIVMNPQTDLDRYYRGPVHGYRASCRPSLDPGVPLARVITSNLATCYAQRVDNTVIYLQNASDSTHVRNQFVPFIAAIDIADQKRVLPRLQYWGREGHKPPPPPAWLDWVTAAIAAPTSIAADIQHIRKEYDPGAPESSAPARHDADYRLATAIVEHAKSHGVETIAPSIDPMLSSRGGDRTTRRT